MPPTLKPERDGWIRHVGRKVKNAVTRIRTGVAAATTQSTNHYTITAQAASQAGVEPTIF